MVHKKKFDMYEDSAPSRFAPGALQALTSKQLASLLKHIPPAMKAVNCAEFLAQCGITGWLNSAENLAIRAEQLRRGDNPVRPIFHDDPVLSNGKVSIVNGVTARSAMFENTSSSSSASSTLSTVAVKSTIDSITVDGKATTITPIPCDGPNRLGLQNISVLTGMVVSLSGPDWISCVNYEAVGKVYQKTLNTVVLLDYSRRIAKAMNQEERWTQMSTMRRQAVTGGTRAVHILEFFQGLDQGDYHAWHSLLSLTLYSENVVHKVLGHGVKVVKKEGTSVLPDEVMKGMTPEERKVVLHYSNGAEPRYLSGALDINVKVKPCKTEDELKKLNEFVATVGSYGSVPFMLFQNKGYTGMMSDRGRRFVSLISITFGLLKMKKRVAITIDSVGDVPVLVTSIIHWCRVLEINPDFVLIVGDGQLAGISSKFREYCKQIAPIDSVRVLWINNGLPSSDVKGSAVKWRARACEFFPFENSVQYVTYGAIYSGFMFGVKQEEGTTDVHERVPPLNGRALDWGDCSEAKGLYTNVPGFVPLTLDFNGEYSFAPVRVTSFQRTEDWYNLVSQHCGMKLASWYSPVSRTSSLLNWLRPCKENTAMSTFERYVEDGLLMVGDMDKFISAATAADVGYSVYDGNQDALSALAPEVSEKQEKQEDSSDDDDAYSTYKDE